MTEAANQLGTINWTIIIITLILAPLSVLTIGVFIKRTINKFFAGWEKFENLKERNIAEWREKFENSLCDIKSIVYKIKEDLHDKIDTKEHENFEKEFYVMKEKILIIEVLIKNIEDKIKGRRKTK